MSVDTGEMKRGVGILVLILDGVRLVANQLTNHTTQRERERGGGGLDYSGS